MIEKVVNPVVLIILILAQTVQFLIMKRNGKKGNPGNFNGLKKLEKKVDKGFDDIRLEMREKNKTCVIHENKLGNIGIELEYLREDIKEVKGDLKKG